MEEHKGPTMIPNLVKGSRNQVEVTSGNLCNSGIRNQTSTIILINLSAHP